MNKLLIILVLFAVSCKSTHKAVRSKVDTVTVTEIKQESKSTETTKTSNNLNTETITQTVETNYFNPDSVKTTTIVTDGKGVVKSVKTTVTTIKQVDRTKIESVKSDQTKLDSKVKAKDNTKTDTKTKKTNPIQWWAIFGILVIVAVGYIYFKGINIKQILNKLLTFK